MDIIEILTDENFEEMKWHDNYIHAISFPDENLQFGLDIDYLFDWILDNQDNTYTFIVSPCVLLFFNVSHLKIDIDFQNIIGLNILDINRINPRLSPNKKITLWDFEIITDKGLIKFEFSGYKQIVKEQPVFSRSQVLTREKWY
ncbi:hypothetical protein [Flavobacterium sp. WV_118_3]|uniref:hypothetical protein n=1 Tax=Flavobacterium sp. WV_118_3 TaxID=3151764 RepID=UPI00321A7F07